MSYRFVGIALFASLAGAADSAAQTCTGAASFANGRARVGAAIGVGKDHKSFSAGLGLGMPKSVFGTATVSRADFDDIDESATVYAVQGGMQLDFPGSAGVQLCPIAAFAHQSGPNNVSGTNLDFSGNSFVLGASTGLVASHSEMFDFVPAGGVSYVSTTAKVKGEIFGFPVDESDSYEFGVVVLAAGLVFNRVVSITPSATLPFGRSDLKPEYTLTVSFNFWRR